VKTKFPYRQHGEALARAWRAAYGGRGTTLLVRAVLVELRLHGATTGAVVAPLPERLALVGERLDYARRLARVKLSPALPAEHLATLLATHPAARLAGILRETFEANIILTQGEAREGTRR
jgi:hypothetical protein